jgi:hypothetical protein
VRRRRDPRAPVLERRPSRDSAARRWVAQAIQVQEQPDVPARRQLYGTGLGCRRGLGSGAVTGIGSARSAEAHPLPSAAGT